MEPHQHEPEPGSYQRVSDSEPVSGFGLLDADSYPMFAVCQDCDRLLQCDAAWMSWFALPEHVSR